MRSPLRALVAGVSLLVAGCAFRGAAPVSETFDVLLRGGVVVDGTGAPRYGADVGIRGDRIARVGDLSNSRARVELDATGLFVAPGFINLHSHANAAGLQRAVNMLTQGVTTELLNPDGGGPPDVEAQLRGVEAAGLAVNVGAYAGFNTVWSATVGPDDVRPTRAQIEEMGRLLVANLERGAWGVSAGLDYKPAYFARTDEVVRILDAARGWRTNFTNHERLTPETGFSSRVGILETLEVGQAAGLVPVVTHMKVQGHEQGSAPGILEEMSRAAARGDYVAADVYPYLAGQTSLAALIIPGWAQEGGRDGMLERFKDGELRARIAAEADEAMAARFGGPGGVYLPRERRELVDVMRELGVSSGGEAVIRILEQESPGAILRFGLEEDLVAILRHPTSAVACDCGASDGGATHPRYFGSYPRVLGRYVRETGALTWEDAVRRMTALPASIIGMVDRGVLAPGTAADVVAFDPATIIDHATFENPTAPSEGIRHVIVNGRVALRDGTPTGEQAGRALFRSRHMPSRPMSVDVERRVAVAGEVALAGYAEQGGAVEVAMDVSQRPRERGARGSFRIRAPGGGLELTATELGVLQTAEGWASFSGRARVGALGEERTFVVVVDAGDPLEPGGAAVLHVAIQGMAPVVGRVSGEPLVTSRW